MAKFKQILRETLESFAIAGVIAFFIITFVTQHFVIPSGSMIPTLNPGDHIMANKLIYRFSEPKRGDIIIFRYPVVPKMRFVKRLIALEGETIEVKNNHVFINGKQLNEPYLRVPTYGHYGPVKIKKGYLFMMGDNRNNSNDSRFWGQLPRKNVVGKAAVRFWPLKEFKIFK